MSNQILYSKDVYYLQVLCNQLGSRDQYGNSLPENGYIDLESKYAIRNLPVLRKATTSNTNERVAITHIQNILNLTPDGVFGASMYNAVVSFQQSKGLVADGVVGPDTWYAFASRINIIIAAFFRSSNDATIDFYKSSDGKNFNNLYCSFLKGRDPSVIYYKNHFMVLTTDYLYDSARNVVQDFAISISNDLKTWTYKPYSVGLMKSNKEKVWASEWYLDDDGKLYVITSYCNGSMELDVDKRNIHKFQTYMIPVNSIALENNVPSITFGKPILLNMSTSSGGSNNRIDAQIIKHKGIYHMFIKNEYNKHIELWTSSILTGNWYLKKSFLVSNSERMEGPCCVKVDGKFYVYADKFETNTGNYYTTTTDFLSFSSWTLINTNPKTGLTRHGCIYNVFQ